MSAAAASGLTALNDTTHPVLYLIGFTHKEDDELEKTFLCPESNAMSTVQCFTEQHYTLLIDMLVT